MPLQRFSSRWLVSENSAWSSDYSSHADTQITPVKSGAMSPRRIVPPSRSRPLKRKASNDITIEEIDDNDDIGYEADVEVRQPDEYDEVETDQESNTEIGGEEGSNSDVKSHEAIIVDRFRRLNCASNVDTQRAAQSFRASPKKRRWSYNSLKRSFSQSVGSATELEDAATLDVDNLTIDPRRQRRRVDQRRSQHSISPRKFNEDRISEDENSSRVVTADTGDDMEIDDCG